MTENGEVYCMKIRNKRRFTILSILLVIVLLVAGGLFVVGGLSRNHSEEVQGMTKESLTGTMTGRVETYFKTRDGTEEGGDIIVTLANPPIGRQKATILVGMEDTSNQILTSIEMQEGETVHIKNDCLAGEYYTPVFTNLSAKSEDDEIEIQYRISIDESPTDLKRPYAG